MRSCRESALGTYSISAIGAVAMCPRYTVRSNSLLTFLILCSTYTKPEDVERHFRVCHLLWCIWLSFVLYCKYTKGRLVDRVFAFRFMRQRSNVSYRPLGYLSQFVIRSRRMETVIGWSGLKGLRFPDVVDLP